MLNLLPKQAQRTARLQHIQAQIGVFLSANGGVELLKVLHMPCSRNTILRSVKQLALPTRATPRVLGVDDWAFRKGKRYGTILVDLEQHQVVDLLEDRTAEQLKSWLKAHSGTEIITRDRASEFTRAIDQAAPKATIPARCILWSRSLASGGSFPFDSEPQCDRANLAGTA